MIVILLDIYHSWVCFKYNNIEYVLDPCLSLLCKKKYYSDIFKADVVAKVLAKDVRDELLNQILNYKYVENELFARFFRHSFGDESYLEYRENKKHEVIIDGSSNVCDPLYRNYSGYKAEIDNGKIKKLTVHYYDNEC